MNKGEMFEAIWITFIVIVFLGLIGACLYHEANLEYKYTADVPCYDKHDSMIENVECKHEVICGPWQDTTPFRDNSLPCDKNDANVSGDEQ